MEEGSQFKRWTATRKIEVVLRLLKGESIDKLSRELGVEVYLLEEWRAKALQGIEAGLKVRPEDPLKQELDHAKKRLGELMMENELLQIKASRAPAFRMGRSKK
jgi:transposase-like protein